MSRSSQSIHCWVHSSELQNSFFLTFIYAFNDGKDRRELWSDLEVFKSGVGNSPWLLSGDFNVIKSPYEKLGGLVLNTYEQ